MDSAQYKAQKVAEAEAAVEAATAKVVKAEAHLAAAHDAVDTALAELARVQVTEYVWEEPQEHVIVRTR
jgi:multidrug resistance efflux pump